MAASDVTELLQRVANGDKQAEADLISEVYGQLRRIAAHYLRGERPDHTLQPTALVNEAYLRLTGKTEIEWQNRSHFFAVAAQVMRRILVDYARNRNADKRGGGQERVQFDERLNISDEQCTLLPDLDRALQHLEQRSTRMAKVVELRYFGGLNEDEIAELLGVSSRTVKRDWTAARAWLYSELSG